jgi:hypothetical protein
MVGGVDKRGGGGSRLEAWQVLVARSLAEQFLASNPPLQTHID